MDAGLTSGIAHTALCARGAALGARLANYAHARAAALRKAPRRPCMRASGRCAPRRACAPQDPKIKEMAEKIAGACSGRGARLGAIGRLGRSLALASAPAFETAFCGAPLDRRSCEGALDGRALRLLQPRAFAAAARSALPAKQRWHRVRFCAPPTPGHPAPRPPGPALPFHLRARTPAPPPPPLKLSIPRPRPALHTPR